MPSFAKKLKGFTLIELLLAIVIASLLSSIGYAAYTGSQKNTRDARRKADLKALQAAIISYYQDHNAFPPATGMGSYQWCARISDPTYSDVKNALVSTYINAIPNDPNKNQSTTYIYYTSTNRLDFKLYAVLENTKDPDYSANVLNNDGYSWCGGYSNTALYNYKTTSK